MKADPTMERATTAGFTMDAALKNMSLARRESQMELDIAAVLVGYGLPREEAREYAKRWSKEATCR